MQRSVQSTPTLGTDGLTVPAELESPRAKLVYLFLSVHGEATVTELQESLEMKKISLYSILGTLCERELVRQNAERYQIPNASV
jgi:predicted transcriptional regulator